MTPENRVSLASFLYGTFLAPSSSGYRLRATSHDAASHATNDHCPSEISSGYLLAGKWIHPLKADGWNWDLKKVPPLSMEISSFSGEPLLIFGVNMTILTLDRTFREDFHCTCSKVHGNQRVIQYFGQKDHCPLKKNQAGTQQSETSIIYQFLPT